MCWAVMGSAVPGSRRASQRSDFGAECGAREGVRKGGKVPAQGVVIPCVYLRLRVSRYSRETVP